MAMDVERLFAEIRPDRDCYLGPTARRLGLSEEEGRELGDELVRAGRCQWGNDKKRSIRRVVPNAAEGDPSSGEPRAVAGLSELARELWRALPPDGSQVTNVDIRSRDEFAEVDERDLQEARRELKRAGLVELRSGRDGGGLRRVDEDQDIEDAADAEIGPPPDERVQERLEHELYEPFRDWLLQELDEDAFVFAEALVTARAKAAGQVDAAGRLPAHRHQFRESAGRNGGAFVMRAEAPGRRRQAGSCVRSGGSWTLGTSRQPCA